MMTRSPGSNRPSSGPPSADAISLVLVAASNDDVSFSAKVVLGVAVAVAAAAEEEEVVVAVVIEADDLAGSALDIRVAGASGTTPFDIDDDDDDDNTGGDDVIVAAVVVAVTPTGEGDDEDEGAGDGENGVGDGVTNEEVVDELDAPIFVV